METLKKIALFASIAAIFITCKKEVLAPSTVENQPIFSFNGSIGGNNISWQAGVNNYYMYSSYNQNASGVYSFIGTLQSTTTNKNSIQITINDYRATPASVKISPQHLDSALSTAASYLLPGSDTAGYSVTITPSIYAGTAQTFTYSFGDMTPNVVTNNKLPIKHTYKTSGIYPTALTVKFNTYGPISMADTIAIFKTQPQLWMDSIHSVVGPPSSNTTLVALTSYGLGGTAPYVYTLNYGDGSAPSVIPSSSDTIASNHTYDSIGKIYSVYVKMKDASGHTQSHNYKFWNNDSGSYNGGLMDYTISAPVAVLNIDSLSDVIITYTDVNGKVYTSNNASQPTISSFVVNSVKGYQTNMNGENTMQLNVTFSCTLYPVLGGLSIQATNCTAVIAVAYH